MSTADRVIGGLRRAHTRTQRPERLRSRNYLNLLVCEYGGTVIAPKEQVKEMAEPRQRWRSRLSGLLDWVMESRCALCNRSTASSLCLDCQRQVKQCQTKNSLLREPDPVFAWGGYAGALKRSITALKYDNQPKLAALLGQWLGQAWNIAAPVQTSLLVLPIPLHQDKLKQRGFNQAELIAEAFCKQTQLPLERHALMRIRATEAQFNLVAEAREQNLTNAFQVNPKFQGRSVKSVLLLDDIYTTGATARAAIQALQQQGISVWGIAAVARAGFQR